MSWPWTSTNPSTVAPAPTGRWIRGSAALLVAKLGDGDGDADWPGAVDDGDPEPQPPSTRALTASPTTHLTRPALTAGPVRSASPVRAKVAAREGLGFKTGPSGVVLGASNFIKAVLPEWSFPTLATWR